MRTPISRVLWLMIRDYAIETNNTQEQRRDSKSANQPCGKAMQEGCLCSVDLSVHCLLIGDGDICVDLMQRSHDRRQQCTRILLCSENETESTIGRLIEGKILRGPRIDIERVLVDIPSTGCFNSRMRGAKNLFVNLCGNPAGGHWTLQLRVDDE